MKKNLIVVLSLFFLGFSFWMIKGCTTNKVDLQQQVDSLINVTVQLKVDVDEQVQLGVIAEINLKACESELVTAKAELLKCKSDKNYNEKNCKIDHESSLLEDSIDMLPVELANQLLSELEGIEDIRAANEYIKAFIGQHRKQISKPNR